MKILLPYQDPHDRPLTHSIVSGGTEMFFKLLNDNFDVEVLQFESKNTLEKKGLYTSKDRQEQQRKIIQKAEECNADVIINNFAWSGFCGTIISESHIPVMNVEHRFYPFLGIINKWNNLVKNGHSLFLVSNFQKKFYDKMTKRAKFELLPFDLINPSYCKTKPDILDIEYDCGTIGRCEKEKNPFKLKHMTKHTDLNTLVITSKSSNEGNSKYYEINKNWNNVIWDKQHDEVIKNISKCKTFFSTWTKETWGITALEALSCGVPIILNCDNNGDHASEIIPAHKSHYKKIPNDDKSALIDAINNFDVDRKEVQEMTLEKHSYDNWKNKIYNSIDKTIKKYKKPSLKYFMNK
jgi:glycosyltransferase involved in cell wall biosynthesis